MSEADNSLTTPSRVFQAPWNIPIPNRDSARRTGAET